MRTPLSLTSLKSQWIIQCHQLPLFQSVKSQVIIAGRFCEEKQAISWEFHGNFLLVPADLLDCNLAYYSQEAELVIVNSVAELQRLDEDTETAYWLDVCNYDATTLMTLGKVVRGEDSF